MKGARRSLQALAAVLLLAASAGRVSAFVCDEFAGRCVRWPGGSAPLRAQLGSPPSGPLINGTFSWDQNAMAAGNDWNAVGAAFRFALETGGPEIDPCAPAGPCSARPAGNPVFFRDGICGRRFGDDIIAATVNCIASDGRIQSSAVFVRDDELWNAYDGPIRFSPGGRVVNDLRRVLLHEFGHVLGLAHPDDNGQAVTALMNARVSNLDRLQADDIMGLLSIYPVAVPPPGANEGCRLQPRASPSAGSWLALGFGVVVLLLLRRR